MRLPRHTPTSHLMRLKQRCFTYIVCFLCLLPCTSMAKTIWRTLRPGLEVTELTPYRFYPIGHIHAFRLDPRRYCLDLVFAKEQGLTSTSVYTLARAEHALVAINGGYFSPDFQPLGLRIVHGHIKNRLHPNPSWAIFSLRHHTPHITSYANYHPHRTTNFAIQSGPRLLIHGKLASLTSQQRAERTAIGITSHQRIIIAVTEHLPITFATFANLMRAPTSKNGLHCRDALNLDGGSSSQLYARIASFNLNVGHWKNWWHWNHIAEALTVHACKKIHAKSLHSLKKPRSRRR